MSRIPDSVVIEDQRQALAHLAAEKEMYAHANRAQAQELATLRAEVERLTQSLLIERGKLEKADEENDRLQARLAEAERLLQETNEALAACQSEGGGWKRLAEERGWKNDSYEYLLSEPGSKTLYWAAVGVANAIRLGIGGMIRGTAMEQDLRDALWLREGEIRDVPKGSTTRTTVTADTALAAKEGK